MNRVVAAVLDTLASAYLCAFAAWGFAGIELLPPPFGVLLPAALGALALIWILR